MHNFVGLHLRNEDTYRQSEKRNLLNSNTSSTCPDNMVNFGPVAAEIRSGVWDPCKFNGFRVLAALLHGTPAVGVSQTYGVEQSAPPIFGRAASRWALAHILVFILLSSIIVL